MKIKLDRHYVGEVNMEVPCPDCQTPMIAREHPDPFANTLNMIVIPLECPNCHFNSVVHIFLGKESE